MRKFLLATSALIALAGPAMSADKRAPVYKAAPVVPLWSWTGCYLGGHAGGVWAKAQDWIVRTPGGVFYGQSLGEHVAAGGIGGVQAGCDYQSAGSFVIGIQGDHAWTNAEGSHDSAREIGVAYHSKVKSLTSVTGRIGYSGIVSSATSGAAPPGSATITGRRPSYSALPIRRVTRDRDGPSASAVNMPSPMSCPASSNIIITTSAPARLRSRRR